MIDPYFILGLPRNATKEEITSKYKKLAKENHPDINKSSDAKQKMQLINRAYDVLKKGFNPHREIPNYPPTAAQVIIININFTYSDDNGTGNSWTMRF